MSNELAGRRIAITRPVESSAGLARRLEAAGATVLLAPAIRRGPPSTWEPLDRGVATLMAGGYAGVLFTSPAAVRPFCDRMQPAGRFPAAVRVGAVGPGTAAALAAVGIEATIIPAKEDGASLAVEVANTFGRALTGTTFLQPRAEEGREELAAGLASKGATVDVVPAYRTTRASAAELRPFVQELRAGRLDAVVFASPSAVDAVMDSLGPSGLGTARAVAIGDTTAGALRARGLDSVWVAATADDDGLCGAVVAALN